MISDKDYQFLAKDVYEVDATKTQTPFQSGDIVGNDRFIILPRFICHNPFNGFQAF